MVNKIVGLSPKAALEALRTNQNQDVPIVIPHRSVLAFAWDVSMLFNRRPTLVVHRRETSDGRTFKADSAVEGSIVMERDVKKWRSSSALTYRFYYGSERLRTAMAYSRLTAPADGSFARIGPIRLAFESDEDHRQSFNHDQESFAACDSSDPKFLVVLARMTNCRECFCTVLYHLATKPAEILHKKLSDFLETVNAPPRQLLDYDERNYFQPGNQSVADRHRLCLWYFAGQTSLSDVISMEAYIRSRNGRVPDGVLPAEEPAPPRQLLSPTTSITHHHHEDNDEEQLEHKESKKPKKPMTEWQLLDADHKCPMLDDYPPAINQPFYAKKLGDAGASSWYKLQIVEKKDGETVVKSRQSQYLVRRNSLHGVAVCKQCKHGGVNVLSIDGGGTRGMMGLEVLEKIEKLSGKRICDLFDMICGVSTGAIIAALLTCKGYTVKECREVYMDVSKRLFSQGKFQGGMGLILKHSYYNTNLWIKILKEMIGEDVTMINTSRKMHTPRLAIIASIVNLPTIQPYIFRNYDHPAGRDSHYRGGTDYPLWTAIQASAAAPLYFSEVKLDNLLLQDGGVYANNPTAIAYHETKLLWPNELINCVISVGNGRTVTSVEPTPTVFSTSIQDKLLRIIDSATDTEGVHMNVHDMLPDNVYYRFNPYMTYSYGLDEIDAERLEQMASDAEFYVRRNSNKLEGAAERLLRQPNIQQRAQRRIKEWFDLKGFYKPA